MELAKNAHRKHSSVELWLAVTFIKPVKTIPALIITTCIRIIKIYHTVNNYSQPCIHLPCMVALSISVVLYTYIHHYSCPAWVYNLNVRYIHWCTFMIRQLNAILTPLMVSAPTRFKCGDILEKNWSTSSWVWPTGRKLTRICNKYNEISLTSTHSMIVSRKRVDINITVSTCDEIWLFP